MPVRRRLFTSRLLVLSMILTACASGLEFRVDQRVAITWPADRSEVTLPLTVQWEITPELAADLADPSRPAAGFAVLLDVEPQPRSEPLSYFARSDDSCRPENGCPDLEWLAARRIFTTRETSFTFDRINPVAGVDIRDGDRDLHEVTIVLLDEPGNRLGESSWTVSFEILHEDRP